MFSSFKDAVTPYIRDILEEVEVVEDQDGELITRPLGDASPTASSQGGTDDEFAGSSDSYQAGLPVEGYGHLQPASPHQFAPGEAEPGWGRPVQGPMAHSFGQSDNGAKSFFEDEESLDGASSASQFDSVDLGTPGPGRDQTRGYNSSALGGAYDSVDLDLDDDSDGGGSSTNDVLGHVDRVHGTGANIEFGDLEDRGEDEEHDEDHDTSRPSILDNSMARVFEAPQPAQSPLTTAFGRTFAHLSKLREFARTPARAESLESRLQRCLQAGLGTMSSGELEVLDQQVADKWNAELRHEPSTICVPVERAELDVLASAAIGMNKVPRGALVALDDKVVRAWQSRFRSSDPALAGPPARASLQSHADRLASMIGMQPIEHDPDDEDLLESSNGHNAEQLLDSGRQEAQGEDEEEEEELVLDVANAKAPLPYANGMRVDAGRLGELEQACAAQGRELADLRGRALEWESERRALEGRLASVLGQLEAASAQADLEREQAVSVARAERDHELAKARAELERAQSGSSQRIADLEGELASERDKAESERVELNATVAELRNELGEAQAREAALAASAQARAEDCARLQGQVLQDEYRKVLDLALRDVLIELAAVGGDRAAEMAQDLMGERVESAGQLRLIAVQQALIGSMRQKLAVQRRQPPSTQDVSGAFKGSSGAATALVLDWGDQTPVAEVEDLLSLVASKVSEPPSATSVHEAVRALEAQLTSRPDSRAESANLAALERAFEKAGAALAPGVSRAPLAHVRGFVQGCAAELALHQNRIAQLESDWIDVSRASIRAIQRCCLAPAVPAATKAGVLEGGTEPRSPAATQTESAIWGHRRPTSPAATQTDLAVIVPEPPRGTQTELDPSRGLAPTSPAATQTELNSPPKSPAATQTDLAVIAPQSPRGTQTELDPSRGLAPTSPAATQTEPNSPPKSPAATQTDLGAAASGNANVAIQAECASVGGMQPEGAHGEETQAATVPGNAGEARSSTVGTVVPTPSPSSGLVDKKLAASVVATCIERSCRHDCLDVVARVLDFDAETRRRVGLDQPTGFWGALLPDWSRGQARAEALGAGDQSFSNLLSDFVQDEIS